MRNNFFIKSLIHGEQMPISYNKREQNLGARDSNKNCDSKKERKNTIRKYANSKIGKVLVSTKVNAKYKYFKNFLSLNDFFPPHDNIRIVAALMKTIYPEEHAKVINGEDKNYYIRNYTFKFFFAKYFVALTEPPSELIENIKQGHSKNNYAYFLYLNKIKQCEYQNKYGLICITPYDLLYLFIPTYKFCKPCIMDVDIHYNSQFTKDFLKYVSYQIEIPKDKILQLLLNPKKNKDLCLVSTTPLKSFNNNQINASNKEDKSSNKVENESIDNNMQDKIISPTIVILRWPLVTLKAYGSEKDVFGFESSKQCTMGRGLFKFMVENGKNIQEAIAHNLQVISDDAQAKKSTARMQKLIERTRASSARHKLPPPPLTPPNTNPNITTMQNQNENITNNLNTSAKDTTANINKTFSLSTGNHFHVNFAENKRRNIKNLKLPSSSDENYSNFLPPQVNDHVNDGNCNKNNFTINNSSNNNNNNNDNTNNETPLLNPKDASSYHIKFCKKENLGNNKSINVGPNFVIRERLSCEAHKEEVGVNQGSPGLAPPPTPITPLNPHTSKRSGAVQGPAQLSFIASPARSLKRFWATYNTLHGRSLERKQIHHRHSLPANSLFGTSSSIPLKNLQFPDAPSSIYCDSNCPSHQKRRKSAFIMGNGNYSILQSATRKLSPFKLYSITPPDLTTKSLSSNAIHLVEDGSTNKNRRFLPHEPLTLKHLSDPDPQRPLNSYSDCILDSGHFFDLKLQKSDEFDDSNEHAKNGNETTPPDSSSSHYYGQDFIKSLNLPKLYTTKGHHNKTKLKKQDSASSTPSKDRRMCITFRHDEKNFPEYSAYMYSSSLSSGSTSNKSSSNAYYKLFNHALNIPKSTPCQEGSAYNMDREPNESLYSNFHPSNGLNRKSQIQGIKELPSVVSPYEQCNLSDIKNNPNQTPIIPSRKFVNDLSMAKTPLKTLDFTPNSKHSNILNPNKSSQNLNEIFEKCYLPMKLSPIKKLVTDPGLLSSSIDINAWKRKPLLFAPPELAFPEKPRTDFTIPNNDTKNVIKNSFFLSDSPSHSTINDLQIDSKISQSIREDYYYPCELSNCDTDGAKPFLLTMQPPDIPKISNHLNICESSTKPVYSLENNEYYEIKVNDQAKTGNCRSESSSQLNYIETDVIFNTGKNATTPKISNTVPTKFPLHQNLPQQALSQTLKSPQRNLTPGPDNSLRNSEYYSPSLDTLVPPTPVLLIPLPQKTFTPQNFDMKNNNFAPPPLPKLRQHPQKSKFDFGDVSLIIAASTAHNSTPVPESPGMLSCTTSLNTSSKNSKTTAKRYSFERIKATLASMMNSKHGELSSPINTVSSNVCPSPRPFSSISGISPLTKDTFTNFFSNRRGLTLPSPSFSLGACSINKSLNNDLFTFPTTIHSKNTSWNKSLKAYRSSYANSLTRRLLPFSSLSLRTTARRLQKARLKAAFRNATLPSPIGSELPVIDEADVARLTQEIANIENYAEIKYSRQHALSHSEANVSGDISTPTANDTGSKLSKTTRNLPPQNPNYTECNLKAWAAAAFIADLK